MAKTPMMQQYMSVKEQYGDAILFFRLGDFYEMFYDDAKLVSRVLGLTLTGKSCGEAERAPMCGVPFHSADTYIGKLVAQGYRVVICEQTEDPATAKGLVRRDVVRIVTPGTLIESSLLADEKNNYLAAVNFGEGEAAVCFADVSTGEIEGTALRGDELTERLCAELATHSPRELLFASVPPQALAVFVTERLGAAVAPSSGTLFDEIAARQRVINQFGKTPEELSLTSPSLTGAVGALIGYIDETQKVELGYIKSLRVYDEGQYLEMDPSTRRSLELCETMRTKEKKGTLLWVLDHTKTAMGSRLLRRWIEMPQRSVPQIQRRQGAVAAFASGFALREECGELLAPVMDLERLLARIAYGTANARDLRAVSATLHVLPELHSLLTDVPSEELAAVIASAADVADVASLIDSAICDDPPVTTREGGMIRPGYSKEVDELNELLNGSRGFLDRIEERERERTGIKNLRVGYNRVFGYYIEVTNSQKDLVPDDYIRKQTLTGGERFITQELKELEGKILGAADKVTALEYSLFTDVRDRVGASRDRLQGCADALALIDVYRSLGEAAALNRYTCPDVDYGDVIQIKEGRHPVVEKFTTGASFVPNDTYLDCAANRLALITGPNMAGKSTYMRQVALIALMAQIGSFVPAASARIGVLDKLFTRVGASDDLASGQSTFMLEMNEVAYILANATPRSLILYDEIGRGTSTFDGMSIARAVAEYTLGKKVGAKALFATHYHELTSMEGELPGVVNYSIAAKKRGDELIFLRKIMRGAADDSYGIEVARLAGVPAEVLRRARATLSSLEQRSAAVAAAEEAENQSDTEVQTFDDIRRADVRDKLLRTDVDSMTPREALDFLYELKKIAE